MLNFKPKGQTRVYVFKSVNDNQEDLLAWYTAFIEHSTRLEEVLFPGTTATVSTMHVFSTLQDRFGAKAGYVRAFLAALNIDYNQASISREPLCKLLRFLPPIRKENPSNLGDSPTASLDVLATNRGGNTISHWVRLMHQPWFYLYKDNLSVYKYLEGTEVGTFVVRFGRFDDIFVLTVKGSHEILHFPVQYSPAGFGFPGAMTFASIYSFLRYYINSPIPSGISLRPFKVVDLEEVGTGPIPVRDFESEKPKKHRKGDSKGGSDPSSPSTSKKSSKGGARPPPPAGPPPSTMPSLPPRGPPQTATTTTDNDYDDEDGAPPPSLSTPAHFDEPPPSLSTPGHAPTSLSSSVSVATIRLTTAYEVSSTPQASYPAPWKVPASLAKSDGWKTAKNGLCRRILLQKGIKVLKEKEMEQVSAIMRILSPDGPIRILKCYALENSRLTTLFEANTSFLEAKLKAQSTAQPKWAESDPTGQRTETNNVYEHFAARCGWNKDAHLKIVPLIYFANEEKLQAVEAEGFDKQQENPEGPYGSGYYMSRSIEEARIKSNNGPFIIAFAAPGRVYPVIEPAINPNEIASTSANKKGRGSVAAAPNSLFGKPCKDGYDAHFVRTCGSTKDDPGVGGVFQNGWTGSEWDQLVLFSMTQAVPRYLVYLE